MMVARQSDRFGPVGPVSQSASISISFSASLPLSFSPLPTVSDSDTFANPTTTTDSVPSTTTLVSSPTSTSPASGSSPFWIFDTSASAVTCQPYQIQWSVSNADNNTNSPTDLSNTVLILSLSNNTTALNLTLTTTQPLLNDTYTWSLVTVPEGTYTVQGTAAGTGASALVSPTDSYILSVKSGPDISCVSSTGNNTNAGTPANFSKSTGTNKAAIAGGTIGGIILTVLISMVVFALYRIRKDPFRRRNARSGGSARGGLSHKDWNGLSSVDSKFPIDNERTAERRDAGSVPGSVLGESEVEDRTGIGAGGATAGVLSNIRPSRRVSQDIDSLSSLEGEKNTDAKEAGLGMETLPVLMRDGKRGSRRDPDGNNEYVFETDIAHGGTFPRPVAVELAQLSPTRTHGAVAMDSACSSDEFGVDPFSAVPTAAGTNTNTTTTTTTTTGGGTGQSANANRRVSRTPRKPVPAYDPMAEEMDVRTKRDRSRSQSRPRSGVGYGHGYSVPMPPASQMNIEMKNAQEAHAHAHAMLHGLQSKSSGQFGMMEGQAMHFLIPDMPPPLQRERDG